MRGTINIKLCSLCLCTPCRSTRDLPRAHLLSACHAGSHHTLHVILSMTVQRVRPFAASVFTILATCYGLDSLGIKSGWGRHLLHLSRLALGPPNFLYSGFQVIPRGKMARVWYWPPPPSSTEFKARNRALPVLHRCAFKAWCRVNFTLTFYFIFIS